jgi:hypothetical protein
MLPVLFSWPKSRSPPSARNGVRQPRTDSVGMPAYLIVIREEEGEEVQGRQRGGGG